MEQRGIENHFGKATLQFISGVIAGQEYVYGLENNDSVIAPDCPFCPLFLRKGANSYEADTYVLHCVVTINKMIIG